MSLAPASTASSKSAGLKVPLHRRLGSFLAGCFGLAVLVGLLLVLCSWFIGDSSVWWQMVSWVPAVAMLPVARGMVDFDLPADCKARDATIETLKALKAEAEGKLGIASSSGPSTSAASASTAFASGAAAAEVAD